MMYSRFSTKWMFRHCNNSIGWIKIITDSDKKPELIGAIDPRDIKIYPPLSTKAIFDFFSWEAKSGDVTPWDAPQTRGSISDINTLLNSKSMTEQSPIPTLTNI